MSSPLTPLFIKQAAACENDPEAARKVAEMVFNEPVTPETTGLKAYLYHEGLGVEKDLDKCFELAEKAALEGGDGLGYFLLGFMCENAETPDQAEGGLRQKYDHYDAERFYEKCSETDTPWAEQAHLWLGEYYIDMACGGDPDVGVEHYEAVAETNSEAAGRLSDYFWNLVMPEYLEDTEWLSKLFKWTTVAARLNPEDYSYRLGWLYADGLGCEQDRNKAVEHFSEAYENDDWRGAKAVAKVYEEYLEENPDLDETERKEFEDEIAEWNRLGDEMHSEQLANNPDYCIEED